MVNTASQPSNGHQGPKCATCRFWRHLPGLGGTTGPISDRAEGECRAHCPKAQIVPNGNGIAVQGLFPPVMAGDWCGEYRSALEVDRDGAGFPRGMKATGEPDAKLRGE